jgi:RNA polymerase sigma factor (sigma-70 family)
MSDGVRDGILGFVRRLCGRPGAGGLGDRELLRRFVLGRDHAAFELLVWRHAALVVDVCRRLLRDGGAVEDAFQAVFVVLFRKAGSIRRADSVAGWLYQVAYRVAARARRRAGKEVVRAGAGFAVEKVPAPAEESGVDAHLRELLHEEVSRLPAKYRAPVVCCYFEGKTLEESAQELGWSKGTVAGRLARARDLLRRRLARRGVALTAGALAGLSAGAASGATPLVEGALGALRALAAGGCVSQGVMSLAEGVMKAMFWNKVKLAAAVVLTLGVSGLGTALWATRPGVARESGDREPPGERRAAEGEKAPEGRPAAKPADPVEEALNRARSRVNLKKVALALQNYNDTYGRLPPPAIADRKSKALLSWRVALLPYLDQQELYKEFKLDEPWDSEHNKKLLAKMPAVYAPVGVKTRVPHATFYQLVVGEGAVFERMVYPGGPGGTSPGTGGGSMMAPGGRGRMGSSGMTPPGGSGPMMSGTGYGRGSSGGRRGSGGSGGGATMPPGTGSMGSGPGPGTGGPTIPASIPDGTSNTILVVEAGTPVPWTKPQDVAYAPDRPIRLGGLFPKVFHAAFADGRVRTLPKDLPAKTLRAAITPAGGEPIDWADVEVSLSLARLRAGKEEMARLRERNEKLKAEAEALREVLGELKAEVEALKRAAEEDGKLSLDPAAAALQKENARLEKSLRQSRDEVRELLREVRRLKDRVKKRDKEED